MTPPASIPLSSAAHPPGATQAQVAPSWARPLTSYEVIIETIGAVTTKTGLKVRAALDTDSYPKGIRITDKDMKTFEARHLQRHQFHGDRNYTICAKPTDHSNHPTRPNNSEYIFSGP